MSKALTPIEAWVKDLRSGKYPQSKRALRNKDGFCCLGVACDTYRKRVGGEWIELLDGTEEYHFRPKGVTREHASGGYLPEPVRAWLGLSSPSGSFREGAPINLANLNDGGESFETIAEVIEKAPEGLLERDEATLVP